MRNGFLALRQCTCVPDSFSMSCTCSLKRSLLVLEPPLIWQRILPSLIGLKSIQKCICMPHAGQNLVSSLRTLPHLLPPAISSFGAGIKLAMAWHANSEGANQMQLWLHKLWGNCSSMDTKMFKAGVGCHR